MIEISYLVFVIFINEAIHFTIHNTQYTIHNTQYTIHNTQYTISDFNACNSDTLDRLHSSFCMHMYGCEHWNLSSSYIDKYIIVWKKTRDEFGKFPLNVTTILFII